MNIKNVVVIGSGTMGSGIAAQLCNAGIPVTLLDLKTEISEKAKKKILESRPPLLIDKSKIENIKVGNIDENFDIIKKADWVVEAVVERIDIKHNLYEKILKTRKKDSIISSNTSTIPLKVLSEKMSDEDKKDFCITHFFNPVRYMGLLEIVSESINDTKKINFLKNFCEDSLGKGVIICKDTPGFLGNRVGVYAMQVAMTEAIKMKLSIEEADAIFGSRSQQQNANDRHANQEIAYLLQRIENYPELIILATNLQHNLDEAFIRRFQSVVHFKTPEVQQRMKLWKTIFHKDLGLSEAYLEKMAEEHQLTGGTLINILQTARLLTEDTTEQLSEASVNFAIQRELKKEENIF